jgi:hypothetical protein
VQISGTGSNSEYEFYSQFATRHSLRKKKPPLVSQRRFFAIDHRDEENFVLGRPGSDLLFQVLRLSTIGAGEFNGRVRDGIGYRPPAKTTRPAKDEL